MTTYVGLAIGGTQLSNRATAPLSVRDQQEKDSHKNGLVKGDQDEIINDIEEIKSRLLKEAKDSYERTKEQIENYE